MFKLRLTEAQKKELFSQAKNLALWVLALIAARWLLAWLGNLSVEYQFGTWWYYLSYGLYLPFVFLVYSVFHSGLQLVHTAASLLREARRDARRAELNAREDVKLEYGVITGIRVDSSITINDRNPLYLQYRLGEEEHEIRMHNPALQEAVGCLLQVYVFPGGGLEPDLDQVDWNRRAEPASETEPKADLTAAGETEAAEQRTLTPPPGDGEDSTASSDAQPGEPNPWVPPIPRQKKGKMVELIVIGLLFFLPGVGVTLLHPMGLIFALAGVVPIWIGIHYLRKMKELERYARPITAQIVEVRKGSRDKNGLMHYYVRCEAEGKQFEEDTVAPPPDAVGKHVIVYVSEKNAGNYEVLLSTVH